MLDKQIVAIVRAKAYIMGSCAHIFSSAVFNVWFGQKIKPASAKAKQQMTGQFSGVEQRFSHPENHEILAFLRKQAIPLTPAKRSPWDIDDFELHTHPDLCDRLQEVASTLPEKCIAALYGCPIFVAKNGIIFAVAIGTSSLKFRLSASDAEQAYELGGQADNGLGKKWVAFDAWQSDLPTRQWIGDLKFWCEQAYHHASEIK